MTDRTTSLREDGFLGISAWGDAERCELVMQRRMLSDGRHEYYDVVEPVKHESGVVLRPLTTLASGSLFAAGEGAEIQGLRGGEPSDPHMPHRVQHLVLAVDPTEISRLNKWITSRYGDSKADTGSFSGLVNGEVMYAPVVRTDTWERGCATLTTIWTAFGTPSASSDVRTVAAVAFKAACPVPGGANTDTKSTAPASQVGATEPSAPDSRSLPRMYRPPKVEPFTDRLISVGLGTQTTTYMFDPAAVPSTELGVLLALAEVERGRLVMGTDSPSAEPVERPGTPEFANRVRVHAAALRDLDDAASRLPSRPTTKELIEAGRNEAQWLRHLMLLGLDNMQGNHEGLRESFRGVRLDERCPDEVAEAESSVEPYEQWSSVTHGIRNCLGSVIFPQRSGLSIGQRWKKYGLYRFLQEFTEVEVEFFEDYP